MKGQRVSRRCVTCVTVLGYEFSIVIMLIHFYLSLKNYNVTFVTQERDVCDGLKKLYFKAKLDTYVIIIRMLNLFSKPIRSRF